MADWDNAAGWVGSGGVGGNPNSDDFTPGPTFESWQTTHFTAVELADPAISGPLGDANGDGTVNLLNYSVGIDPWLQIPPSSLPTVDVVHGRLRV
mgnify:CR=1 FL=1